MSRSELANVKKILVITLSNIGDVILTTPVIDLLKKEIPGGHLTIMVGPKAGELFDGAPGVEVMVYDKFIPLRDKLKLALALRKKGYDLVVDLRNTLFPYLLGAKHRTGFLTRAPKDVLHMKDRHLYKLKSLGMAVDKASFYIWIGPKDEAYVNNLLSKFEISTTDRLVAVCPGARNDIKRWSKEGFRELSDRLMEQGNKVLMIGDEEDRELIRQIGLAMREAPIMVGGKTNLRQLACLLKRCRLLITNDSAPMHIGAALGVRTLAIFGPTDPKKYGPVGEKHSIVRNENLACSPCEVARCSQDHECMKGISTEEVYRVAQRMLL